MSSFIIHLIYPRKFAKNQSIVTVAIHYQELTLFTTYTNHCLTGRPQKIDETLTTTEKAVSTKLNMNIYVKQVHSGGAR